LSPAQAGRRSDFVNFQRENLHETPYHAVSMRLAAGGRIDAGRRLLTNW
jgi:hypothetical protein